jgi:hypothetical protein
MCYGATCARPRPTGSSFSVCPCGRGNERSASSRCLHPSATSAADSDGSPVVNRYLRSRRSSAEILWRSMLRPVFHRADERSALTRWSASWRWSSSASPSPAPAAHGVRSAPSWGRPARATSAATTATSPRPPNRPPATANCTPPFGARASQLRAHHPRLTRPSERRHTPTLPQPPETSAPIGHSGLDAHLLCGTRELPTLYISPNRQISPAGRPTAPQA